MSYAESLVNTIMGCELPRDIERERRNKIGLSLREVNADRAARGLPKVQRAFTEAEHPGGARSASTGAAIARSGFPVID